MSWALALPRRRQLGRRSELGSASAVDRARRQAAADDRLRPGGADRVRGHYGDVRRARCSSPTCTWTTWAASSACSTRPISIRQRRGKVQLYVPAPVVPLPAAALGRLSERDRRRRRQLLGCVPAGAGVARLLARRLLVRRVPGAPPLAGHGVRPAPAGQRWSGPATPGRSRKCWRGSPMPANWSRTTARCTAIHRTAASTTWSANIRANCSRAACCTTTASAADGEALRARGHRVADAGEVRRRLPIRHRCRSSTHERADCHGALPQSRGVAARRRWARPLRDLRVSVIEACNLPLPVLHARRPHRRRTRRSTASRDWASTRSKPLVRGFVRLGVRKLRLTGGEPLLRKRPAGTGGAPRARFPGIEDLALTTNGSLLAGTGAAPCARPDCTA